MTARNAGRAAAPAPPPPPGPSFLRRHPVLAGFGVLAALSLFAAYWPVSAIVTAVVVAGRATGVDRVSYEAARRALGAVVARISRGRSPEVPSTPPELPSPAPEPPEPQPTSASPPGPSAPLPAPSVPAPAAPPRPRRQRPAVKRGPGPKTPTGAGL